MLGIYADKPMVVTIVVLSMFVLIMPFILKRFIDEVCDINGLNRNLVLKLIELYFAGLLLSAAIAVFIIFTYQGRLTIFWIS